MNETGPAFDPIWETEIYGEGKHLNRYPFDIVVSFIYRHYPRQIPRNQVSILEIGCGAGNNLWFASREGFRVAGIDGSRSSIEYARSRFAEEGLSGDFRVGDFTDLPFDDDAFDLVIDRGAITCCGLMPAQQAVRAAWRVLKPGGKFLCNPYSDRHSSNVSGRPGPDGLRLGISAGALVGVGQLCFYGRRDVERMFASRWKLLSMQHLELVETLEPLYSVHAEWRIIVEKTLADGAS
jgi:SAM-dependent methyltransferase